MSITLVHACTAGCLHAIVVNGLNSGGRVSPLALFFLGTELKKQLNGNMSMNHSRELLLGSLTSSLM